MPGANTPNSKPSIATKPAAGRLFFLEVSTNRIQTMNPDGSNRKVIVTDCQLPDSLAVDVRAGQVYWTNMGSAIDVNDGSIERADIDGRARKVIVPLGATFAPKQIQLDQKNNKLYWCDRERMRVTRCNLDGSEIETLIEAGRGEVDRRDPTKWCVGITIDTERQQMYWTQKGPENGRPRAGNEAAARRSRRRTLAPYRPRIRRQNTPAVFGGREDAIILEKTAGARRISLGAGALPPRSM
ncbi:hypothetical protein [Bradyrhizobium sp. 164]|uniref:hypothetical protein n=1 Tax=Bradyrhizobium sp. 164 TaxID=2782637 RepID=UPI001FFA483E|nr:hypothetical protein [Bradyrhizobium sp. 164]MCK1595957.1 3-hydroxyacyl-CoA dehydrogenase [Bradyrhizobium sp. 164]